MPLPKSAARPVAKKAAVKAAPRRDGYHHGSLHDALIDSAEAVLAERGLEGFSLREVARRSGVSPAAPAHHFGDANGLLAAVATQAFQALTEALEAGNTRGGDDPAAQLREQGVGYVDFALRHPGRFGLMFRCGPHEDEAVSNSGQAAFAVLEEGVRRLCGVQAPTPLSGAQRQALLALWSVVHGFSHLALAGQFDGFTPPGGREALLRETLQPLLAQQVLALQATVAAPAPAARQGRRRVKA